MHRSSAAVLALSALLLAACADVPAPTQTIRAPAPLASLATDAFTVNAAACTYTATAGFRCGFDVTAPVWSDLQFNWGGTFDLTYDCVNPKNQRAHGSGSARMDGTSTMGGWATAWTTTNLTVDMPVPSTVKESDRATGVCKGNSVVHVTSYTLVDWSIDIQKYGDAASHVCIGTKPGCTTL